MSPPQLTSTVDHLAGSEGLEPLEVLRVAGAGNDPGPERGCNLDARDAHPTGCAEHGDRLALEQPCALGSSMRRAVP